MAGDLLGWRLGCRGEVVEAAGERQRNDEIVGSGGPDDADLLVVDVDRVAEGPGMFDFTSFGVPDLDGAVGGAGDE